MALHINLYNELQQEAEARRRDPVKLATLGGVLFVCALVAYYLYRSSEVAVMQTRVRGLQAEWAKLEPQDKAARTRETELLQQQKNNQSLIDRIQGRFYWASFLDRFVAAVPANVQITSLIGDCQTTAKPVSVILTGIAAGQQARGVAEQFRIGLQQKLSAYYAELTARFDANSLEDSPTPADIDGKSLPTATFRIRLEFNCKPPVPEQTPAPSATPRAPKKRS